MKWNARTLLHFTINFIIHTKISRIRKLIKDKSIQIGERLVFKGCGEALGLDKCHQHLGGESHLTRESDIKGADESGGPV